MLIHLLKNIREGFNFSAIGTTPHLKRVDTCGPVYMPLPASPNQPMQPNKFLAGNISKISIGFVVYGHILTSYAHVFVYSMGFA